MSSSGLKLNLRQPPHQDFLNGFPGIPRPDGKPGATVGGTLEVSQSAKPVKASWAKVDFRKIESLPTGQQVASSLGSATLWGAPGGNEWKEFPHGFRGDFQIAVPDSIPPSVELPKANIYYELVASVIIKTKKGLLRKDASDTVRIVERIHVIKHDTLSTWPRFQKPDTHQTVSGPILAVLQRPSTCYPPNKELRCLLTLRTSGGAPVNVAEASLELVEKVSYKLPPAATAAVAKSGKKFAQPPSTEEVLQANPTPLRERLVPGREPRWELTLIVPPADKRRPTAWGAFVRVDHVLRLRVKAEGMKEIVLEASCLLTLFEETVERDFMRKIPPTAVFSPAASSAAPFTEPGCSPPVVTPPHLNLNTNALSGDEYFSGGFVGGGGLAPPHSNGFDLPSDRKEQNLYNDARASVQQAALRPPLLQQHSALSNSSGGFFVANADPDSASTPTDYKAPFSNAPAPADPSALDENRALAPRDRLQAVATSSAAGRSDPPPLPPVKDATHATPPRSNGTAPSPNSPSRNGPAFVAAPAPPSAPAQQFPRTADEKHAFFEAERRVAEAHQRARLQSTPDRAAATSSLAQGSSSPQPSTTAIAGGSRLSAATAPSSSAFPSAEEEKAALARRYQAAQEAVRRTHASQSESRSSSPPYYAAPPPEPAHTSMYQPSPPPSSPPSASGSRFSAAPVSSLSEYPSAEEEKAELSRRFEEAQAAVNRTHAAANQPVPTSPPSYAASSDAGHSSRPSASAAGAAPTPPASSVGHGFPTATEEKARYAAALAGVEKTLGGGASSSAVSAYATPPQSSPRLSSYSPPASHDGHRARTGRQSSGVPRDYANVLSAFQAVPSVLSHRLSAVPQGPAYTPPAQDQNYLYGQQNGFSASAPNGAGAPPRSSSSHSTLPPPPSAAAPPRVPPLLHTNVDEKEQMRRYYAARDAVAANAALGEGTSSASYGPPGYDAPPPGPPPGDDDGPPAFAGGFVAPMMAADEKARLAARDREEVESSAAGPPSAYAGQASPVLGSAAPSAHASDFDAPFVTSPLDMHPPASAPSCHNGSYSAEQHSFQLAMSSAFQNATPADVPRNSPSPSPPGSPETFLRRDPTISLGKRPARHSPSPPPEMPALPSMPPPRPAKPREYQVELRPVSPFSLGTEFQSLSSFAASDNR